MMNSSQIFDLVTELTWATKNLNVAGCTHSPDWADGREVTESVTCEHYYKAGMSDLDKAIGIACPAFAEYRKQTELTSRVSTLHNPNHSGIMADDEQYPTACPHCGNSYYDSECRCEKCGLWDLDGERAKRFRLAELVKGMTGEELDKAFSLIVMEVIE